MENDKNIKINEFMDEINNEIQNLNKKIENLSIKINKKEDDIKNIINLKDNIIGQLNNQINEQKNLIIQNKNEIEKLNEKINDIYSLNKKQKDKIYLLKIIEKNYKSYFNIIINYIDKTICKAYIENENKLRKHTLENEAESIIRYEYELNNMYKNIKVELNNKIELFRTIYNFDNEDFKIMILNDYLKYYIIKYSEESGSKINEKLVNLLKLIIKIKYSKNHNQHFEFQNTFDEFIKIVLFTQGYKEVIQSFIDVYINITKYCSNIEEKIESLLDKDLFIYEISERNKKFTKIVNLNLFNLMEAFIRAILLFSIDLIQKDKVKFFEYFYYLHSLEAIMERINKKYFLYSKEIYTLRYIIKIEEGYKSNQDQFETNYIHIMKNLLEQSTYLFKANYNSLYNSTLELAKIVERSFKEKNNNYINLLIFIYKQQYKNIYNDEIRIKLVENLLSNKLLVKKSKIFLSEILKDVKPELLKKKQKDKKYDEEKEKEKLIKNFLNINNNKNLKVFKSLINKCNSINSAELNEILLYFFEGQCQSYFTAILEKFDNKYNEQSCEELLLHISLEYLKKAIQYLYEHKNNNDNNFLKLYAIAYLKTYCYYYVEINFSNYDKLNFELINKVLIDKEENNHLIRNMRNIYILRLFFKKYDNFQKFINNNNINNSIFTDFKNKLKKQKVKVKNEYIFKESFITSNALEIYKKLSLQIDDKFIKNINNIELEYDEINNNFDAYYCFLVNKIISYTYGNARNNFVNIMKNIYNSSYKNIKLGEEGKKLYYYLLNDNLFQNEVIKKISDNPLTQNEFEILLYSLRFIFNTQINNSQCFYNEILKKNSSNFIMNNFIPGTFPVINEYLKSYNELKEKLKVRLNNFGYYICSDCGFLYEVRPCGFPMTKEKCPNGHIIGGTNYICFKKDIRVFYEQSDIQKCINYWKNPDWHNSYISTTLSDFKSNYVDNCDIKPKKGITNNCDYRQFEEKSPIRDINIITFRILNFILYSYLLGGFILNNINKNEVQNYLVENLFPHTLFGILKKNWELLNIYLREIGIDNIQIFLNMIFTKLIEFIKNLKSVDTVDKLLAFEKEVDKYIMSLISKKEDIIKLKEEYQDLNNELNNFDPYNIKEIILGNYDPSFYDQNLYPDIQYYSISNIQSYEAFVNKFNSSKENEDKY